MSQLKRQPSLRTMQMFTEKTQRRAKEVGERHAYCSVRWDCSAYEHSEKLRFEINWSLDNRVLDFEKWEDLTAYVETMLEKREHARQRT